VPTITTADAREIESDAANASHEIDTARLSTVVRLTEACAFGLAALPGAELNLSESPVGASRFVYTRYFVHDFPERGPSLFDPAHIARSHSCRQSLRQ
jgi:hypothetical protein